jgi:hypothetical protein
MSLSEPAMVVGSLSLGAVESFNANLLFDPHEGLGDDPRSREATAEV